MASLPEIIQIMTGLAALYPRHEIHEATFSAYHRVLHDIPADLLDMAALDLGSTQTFYPSAAELRQAAFRLADAGGYWLPSSDEALAEVVRGLARWGRYHAPEWSNPLIGQAVSSIGGWLALCDSTNWAADRARFLDAYNRLAARKKAEAEMLPEVKQAVKALAARFDAGALPAGRQDAGDVIKALALTGVSSLAQG